MSNGRGTQHSGPVTWREGPAYLVIQNSTLQEFPGGPVVMARQLHCQRLGSIPGRGSRIPQAVWCSRNKNFFN